MGTTDGQVDYTGWMLLGDQQAGSRHGVGVGYSGYIHVYGALEWDGR